MWSALKNNTASPRTDLVLNIDSVEPFVSVRRGDWKYVNGSTHSGQTDQWYGETGALADPYDPKTILQSPTSVSLAGYITRRQIHEKKKTNIDAEDTYSLELLRTSKILSLRDEATINCGFGPDNSVNTPCNPIEAPCLFNVKDDPCERNNLASVRSSIKASMEEFAQKYIDSSKPPSNLPIDFDADPRKHDNLWVSWKDDHLSVRSIFSSLSNTFIIIFAVFCALACLSIVTVLVVTMKKNDCFGSVRSRSSRNSRLPRNLEGERRRIHTREPVIVPPVSVAQRVEMFEEREHSI